MRNNFVQKLVAECAPWSTRSCRRSTRRIRAASACRPPARRRRPAHGAAPGPAEQVTRPAAWPTAPPPTPTRRPAQADRRGRSRAARPAQPARRSGAGDRRAQARRRLAGVSPRARSGRSSTRLKARNAGPLPTESVAPIWREIMSACRALETPTRVAYLGPAGTFSELAALGYFGSSIVRVPCASIDEVFHATSAGAADSASCRSRTPAKASSRARSTCS